VSELYSLWEKLSRSKKYRESFAASVVKRMIPLQVRVLRKQREWSQARLGKESQLTQGVISRAEDPDYGNLTLNTLARIAGGFDCAFVGRFVPFSELGKWYTTLDHEDALRVPSFEHDAGFIERMGVTQASRVRPSLSYAVNARGAVPGLGNQHLPSAPWKPISLDLGGFSEMTLTANETTKPRHQNLTLDNVLYQQNNVIPMRELMERAHG